MGTFDQQMREKNDAVFEVTRLKALEPPDQMKILEASMQAAKLELQIAEGRTPDRKAISLISAISLLQDGLEAARKLNIVWEPECQK